MPHDTRDAIVDYVRDWNRKSDIPVSLLLRWVGITSSKYHDWKTRFGKVNEHNAHVPRDTGSPTTRKPASTPSLAHIPSKAIDDSLS